MPRFLPWTWRPPPSPLAYLLCISHVQGPKQGCEFLHHLLLLPSSPLTNFLAPCGYSGQMFWRALCHLCFSCQMHMQLPLAVFTVCPWCPLCTVWPWWVQDSHVCLQLSVSRVHVAWAFLSHLAPHRLSCHPCHHSTTLPFSLHCLPFHLLTFHTSLLLSICFLIVFTPLTLKPKLKCRL